MNWLYKISFDDWFNDKPKEEVRRDPPKSEQITIPVYRGFNADMENLQREGEYLVLSPHKSEQGVMWFSRDKQDAQGRGKYLVRNCRYGICY